MRFANISAVIFLQHSLFAPSLAFSSIRQRANARAARAGDHDPFAVHKLDCDLPEDTLDILCAVKDKNSFISKGMAGLGFATAQLGATKVCQTPCF